MHRDVREDAFALRRKAQGTGCEVPSAIVYGVGRGRAAMSGIILT